MPNETGSGTAGTCDETRELVVERELIEARGAGREAVDKRRRARWTGAVLVVRRLVLLGGVREGADVEVGAGR